jgi:hypothetical protein
LALMSSSFTTGVSMEHADWRPFRLLLCAQFAYFLSSGLATRLEGR